MPPSTIWGSPCWSKAGERCACMVVLWMPELLHFLRIVVHCVCCRIGEAVPLLEQSVGCEGITGMAVEVLRDVTIHQIQQAPQRTPGGQRRHGGAVPHLPCPTVYALTAELSSPTACALAAELMERWGRVLALPELQRFTEAAWHCEHGAVQATDVQQADQILER